MGDPKTTPQARIFPVEAAPEELATLPPVGSVWRTDDGRTLRLERWVRLPDTGEYRARFDVIAADRRRNVRTDLGLRHFGHRLVPAETRQ